MGDAASDVLADGTFMLQQPCHTCLTNPDLTVDDALLNANNLSWTVIPATGKTDPNDEEAWTLEPSGQLLTLDIWSPPATELYTPRSRPLELRREARPSPAARRPMPGCGDRAAGRDAGRQHVRGRCRHEHAEAPTPCTSAPTHDGALHYTAGAVERGAEDPDLRRLAVRQRRWAGRRSCRTETCCST